MHTLPRYRDRVAAGQTLARLLRYRLLPGKDTLVLALPRGGVPVAAEIAHVFGCPLDVFIVRKLGLPSQPEVAMGALATGGICLLNDALIRESGLSAVEVTRVVEQESIELSRREGAYRSGRAQLDVEGRHVLLVDDGVATGFSMRAAILALRASKPLRLVVAVPVGAPETCRQLALEADELVCPIEPHPFGAVGLWYDHFPQLDDGDVGSIMARAAEEQQGAA